MAKYPLMVNLRKLREAADYNQTEFGIICGFTTSSYGQSNYRKIENGNIRLTLQQAYNIQQIFKITTGQLLDLEDWINPVSDEHIITRMEAQYRVSERVKRIARLEFTTSLYQDENFLKGDTNYE